MGSRSFTPVPNVNIPVVKGHDTRNKDGKKAMFYYLKHWELWKIFHGAMEWEKGKQSTPKTGEEDWSKGGKGDNWWDAKGKGARNGCFRFL